MSDKFEDDFVEDDDDLSSSEASPSSERASGPEKKKPNVAVMAAMGVGVLAVIGFAGLQVYNKLAGDSGAPAADPGFVAQQAVQQQPVQPMVPAQPTQAMPGQAMAPAGVVPAPDMGATAQPAVPVPGAAAAPNAVIQPIGQPVPAVPGVVSPDLRAGAANPSSNKPDGMVAGGPVDMKALMELKNAQEEQGRKISDLDRRIAALEAAIQGGVAQKAVKHVKASKHSAPDQEGADEVAPTKQLKWKKSQLEKKRATEWKKASAHKKQLEAKLLSKRAGEKRTEAQRGGKDPAHETPAMPPAPVFAKPDEVRPEAKPQAAPQPPVNLSNMKVQAVIPGRVWVTEDSGVVRSYAQGDALRSGVVIKHIDAERGVVTTSAGVLK